MAYGPAVPLTAIPATSTNEYAKARVEEVFKDTPILIDVAWCESRIRQFDDDGSVLLGKVDKNDTGVMQVNKYYHLEPSRKLGLDINTVDGNLAYALVLYKQNGLRDWNASRDCWENRQKVNVI